MKPNLKNCLPKVFLYGFNYKFLVLKRAKKIVTISLISLLFSNNLFADYTINAGSSVDPASTPGLLNATGTISIYGTMAVNSSVTFTSSTPLNIIIYGSSGQIYWYANKTLALPAGSTITFVNNPSAPPGLQPTSGSASQILQIGSVKYAAANDNSNNVVFSFSQLNSIGGTATVSPSTTTPNTCYGSSINFLANQLLPSGANFYITWTTSSGAGSFSDNNTSTAASTTLSGLSVGSCTVTCYLYSNGGSGSYFLVSTDSIAISVNAIPNPVIEFTQGQNDHTDNISACGFAGGGNQNDLDIYSGNPGGSSTLQWQVSYDNGSTWTNAPGPTNTTTQYVLDPLYTTYENMAGVYLFRLIITNNGCAGISNSIKLTVTGTSNLTPGSIGTNQSYCVSSKVPAKLTSVSLPTGSTGSYTYQWQSSTDNVTFTNISGATSSSYSPSTITQTTYYRRVVVSGGCSATSNTVTVSLYTPPTITGTLNVCAGSTTQLTGSGTPAGSTPWISSSAGVATVSNSGLVTGVSSGTSTITYTNNNGCSITATVTVSIIPSITGSLSVCTGSTTQLTGSGTAAASNPWISASTAVATVNNTGLVTGVSSGTSVITYTNNNGCSNTASVTVNPLPSATISYSGTPYCSGSGTATVSFTGTSGGTYSSTTGLAINSATGAITLGTSTTGSYTVTYTVGASGGCSQYQTTASISIVIPGTWSGAINTDWNTSGNWLCGAIPTSTTNAIIPGSLTNYPVLNSGTGSVQDLTINNGASLTVNGVVLQISGTITNNGLFYDTLGTIEMSGTSAQTIPANTFYNNDVYNLVVNNTSGVSLGGALDVYNSLTYAGTGMSFNTNNYLALKSTASGTAYLGDMTGNTISGMATVERYNSARKGWRLLSIPTNTTQTIQQAWQEGCGANLNCVPGYGTQVSGAAGTAAGFDLATSTPSMKAYNSATGAWVGVPNSNSTGINTVYGYMVFVRGDRSVTSAFAAATPTVLRSRGALYVGDQPSINILANQFAAIGNPYAAPLDIRNITKTGMKDFFYVWDPMLSGSSGYGAYQAFSNNGSGNYVVTPGGGSYGDDNSVSNYIQSGQAFFVQANASGGSITLKEGAKSTGSSLVSAPASLPYPSLQVSLYGVNPDSSTYMADGFLVNYGDNFSNNIDSLDAIKFANTSENLSIKRAGILLVIERRQTIKSQDTIPFNLTTVNVQYYRFVVMAGRVYQPGLRGYLLDNYLQTSTPLNIDGSTTINFNIANIPGSYAANRFEIVFSVTPDLVLPVTFTTVQAVPEGTGVNIMWKVENETNITQYEVEKSTDGNGFNTMTTTQAKANNGASASYLAIDNNPEDGYDYYRIKSRDTRGQITYSQVVKVRIAIAGMGISVYPNPVSNSKINITFRNVPGGNYGLRLFNKAGQVVMKKKIQFAGGTGAESIQLGKYTSRGIYQLEIENPDGSVSSINVIR